MKILSHENECVYNTSTTVYTQKQPSCVTLNYEAASCLTAVGSLVKPGTGNIWFISRSHQNLNLTQGVFKLLSIKNVSRSKIDLFYFSIEFSGDILCLLYFMLETIINWWWCQRLHVCSFGLVRQNHDLQVLNVGWYKINIDKIHNQ